MASTDYKRILSIKLPPRQSAFLWGARKTGKTTLLLQQFPDSIYYDLLSSDIYFSLLERPARLGEELKAKSKDALKRPIIIDEVQKIPALLDEVHRLIERDKFSFLLCGSSARKLKRGQANLLGGRAWRFELFPLVSAEISDFNLIRALNHGLIPAHYNATFIRRSLQAYVQDYLKEEIQAEALTRNLAAFSKFLQCAAIMHGQIVNYTKIGSDVGVDKKSVKAYFEILIDTLLGHFLESYSPKKLSRKDLLQMPKFYFFDVGLAAHLRGVKIETLQGQEAGLLFESFLLQELISYQSYNEIDSPISYIRTHRGVEIDFILQEGAILIQSTVAEKLRVEDLSSFEHLLDLFPRSQRIVVCNERTSRVVGGSAGKLKIEIIPWKTFLTMLWQGEIL